MAGKGYIGILRFERGHQIGFIVHSQKDVDDMAEKIAHQQEGYMRGTPPATIQFREAIHDEAFFLLPSGIVTVVGVGRIFIDSDKIAMPGRDFDPFAVPHGRG